MSSPNLDTWNKRILLLMQHTIDSGLCDSQKAFLESIGFPPSGLRQVKSGAQGFTVGHIAKACKKYKVDANWVLGLSQEMKIQKGKTALQNLKDAVRAVEAQLGE